MAGYTPGTMWAQNVRRRDNEAAREAANLRAIQAQEAARLRAMEQREYDAASKVFTSITEAMEGATPAEGKILRKRFEGLIQSMEKRYPKLSYTLQARYPMEFRKYKMQALMMDNPPPKKQMPPEAKPADNYALAAQDVVNQELYRVKIANGMGKDEKAQHLLPLDERMAVKLDGDSGKWELVDWEMVNTDPKIKELLDKKNMSLIELQAKGGNYEESTLKVLGTDEEGNPYETVYQVTKNVFEPELQLSKLTSSRRPQTARGPTHGEAPPPSAKAENLIVSLSSGQRPDATKAPTEAALYDDIERMGRDYYNLYKETVGDDNKAMVKQAWEEQLEKKLQQLAPEHCFILQPGLVMGPSGAPVEGEKVSIAGVFRGRFAVGNQSTIKAVYGKREVLMSADGEPVDVILDRANNIAYDPDGEVIPGKTIEKAMEYVGGKTFEELIGGE